MIATLASKITIFIQQIAARFCHINVLSKTMTTETSCVSVFTAAMCLIALTLRKNGFNLPTFSFFNDGRAHMYLNSIILATTFLVNLFRTGLNRH